MPENFDLFISHATSDDETVNRIYTAVTDAGLTAWVDHQRGITYGDNWSRAIHDALNNCRYGLFIISPASVKSEYCDSEWNRILGLSKRLYTAVITAVPRPDIPARLGVIQPANLVDDFDGKLSDLIAEIKRHRDSTTAAPTITPAGALTGPFPYLQLDLPMIGRDEDFKIVSEMLKNHRAVQILGLGGIGKTRLLAEFAWRGGYADGVIWHDMATYPALEQLSALIRDHLGLPPGTDDDQTWAILNQRAVLLALDNGETAANPAAYAARISRIDPNGGTRVLLTSRLRWDDLRNAPQRDLRAPSPESAVKIFEAMAEAEPPAHKPGDQAAVLAEAARYHPRLMWYAVRWLDDFPPTRVLAMLRDLKGADAEAALEDMIGRTVKQLQADPGGEDALTALKKLAVCKGGFTFEAAEALGAADGLRLLRRRGLVRVESERYEIDPLVIAAVGVDESARLAHYDYYKALAELHRKKQDYLGLDVESANLEAAFEWMMATNEVEAAYWLAEACREFLANRGRFGQLLDWFTRLEAELNDVPEGRLRSAFYNSLGLVYLEYPTGSVLDNLRRAIVAFEATLVYYTPQAAPLDFAMTHNNLGIAYQNLSKIEDHTDNLRRAITAYEAALVYFTPQAAPLDFAMTQNNLGAAYRDLSQIEDRADNLRRAITAYEAALIYHTPQDAPLDFARTQNNLGIAYRNLSEIEDRADNLRRAITAYQAALVYFTPQAAPLDFAMTQNNLGNAYTDLAKVEDRADNLRRAITAYEAALIYHTPQDAPLDFARTQNNLGNAYSNLAQIEDRADNLRRAITAYEAALVYRTPQTAPLGFARTQANMGVIHQELSELDAACACWREAERYFRQIGYLADADKMLRWMDEAGCSP